MGNPKPNEQGRMKQLGLGPVTVMLFSGLFVLGCGGASQPCDYGYRGAKTPNSGVTISALPVRNRFD